MTLFVEPAFEPNGTIRGRWAGEAPDFPIVYDFDDGGTRRDAAIVTTRHDLRLACTNCGHQEFIVLERGARDAHGTKTGVDVEASINELGSSSPRQAAVLKILSDRGEMMAGELTRVAGCSYDSIHRLVKKELVELF